VDDLSVSTYVRASVGLSSALWKNSGSDLEFWMQFGIIGRTGQRMRQVVRLGIGPLLGANLGRTIVTNVDFTAYVCDSASTVGAEVWGGTCGGPSHCCIRWGPRRAREGEALGVPHFHNGKCLWVADGEMFPLRMRKLYNISVRQTYHWKARFVCFFALYSVSRLNWGL